MSRKNRKSRTTGATDERHLHAVADAADQQDTPATAEDKVRAAVEANPDSTTAELALAAGVGRSTAGKILASWGRDGIVARTVGVGPRDPDTWSLAAADTPTRDIEQPDANHTTPSVAPGTEDTGGVDDPSTDEDDTASQAEASDPQHDAASVARPEPPTASCVDSAKQAGSPAGFSAAHAVSTGTSPTAKGRLAKGGLRAMVEEYLTEHAGQSFGPARIGKELGRSGGAVNNALEKLVADGYAIKTCEAPKRFAINPAKTDVPREAPDTA